MNVLRTHASLPTDPGRPDPLGPGPLRAVRGVVLGLLSLALAACAAPGGPVAPEVRPAVTALPGAEATAEYLTGRMLELEGKLLEASQAYERAAKADPESPEIQRQLASVWMRMGQPELALEFAERAFELEPDEEDTRRALAMLNVSLKRYPEAIELLEPRFAADALSMEGLYGLMSLYLETGDFEKAEQVARHMIAKEPLDARSHFALGAVLQQRQGAEEAERVYRRALRVIPDDPRFYDAIARLRQDEGDVAAEIEVLEEKLRAFPDDPPTLRRIAELEVQAGNREAAIQVLEQLIERHPDQLNARFQLGFFYYEAEEFEPAIEAFRDVVSRAAALGDERRANEVRYFLGRALHRAERGPEALEVFAAIPESSERYPDARVVMARIHEEAEDWDRALAEARIGAAAAPENATLQSYVAGLLQRAGDLEGAVSIMNGLIDTNPSDAELYYDLGLIYGNAGEEDRALEIMIQALERDSDHASALNYVGYSWADRGEKLDEAEIYIRRAVELRPDDGYITDSLGWVIYQRGLKQLAQGEAEAARASFGLAIQQLELAIELLEEDDPIITRHLADAYRSVSRFEEALAAYRRALELDPEPEEAEDIRRQIELLESQQRGTYESGEAR